MANYALVNNKGIVVQVTFVPNQYATTEEEGRNYLHSQGLSGNWVQTSFNTRANVHYTRTYQMVGSDVAYLKDIPDGGTPFRKNYANLGYKYDPTRDAFIPPKSVVYSSWVFDEATCTWIPPVPYPEDFHKNLYHWDEPNKKWSYVMPLDDYLKTLPTSPSS